MKQQHITHGLLDEELREQSRLTAASEETSRKS